MLRQKTLSWIRTIALAALGSLALGSMAWGQAWGQYDDDDYYYRHDEAREHGFSNGYRDGVRAGQYDSERSRRFNFKNDDWEDSRGPNTGWVITGVTNRLIARDMNGDIAEPTATTTAATEIAMTTAGAIATGDSRIEERVAGCPILTSRTLRY
jgi:nitrogen fixation-related uncharacterized protein